MKVTAIKQQQKRQDRYSVYIDDEYAFSVSEGDLLTLRLSKGQELDQVELERLLQTATLGKAYDKALNYLSIRPRSEQEIKRYLQRKDYDPSVIDEVVKKLKRLQMIDDAVFARQWLEWRGLSRPRSRLKLYAELKQKGIDNDTIEAALESVSSESQVEAVRAIIAKKGHRYDSRQKLMSYLSQQGFTYDTIRQALDRPDQSD